MEKQLTDIQEVEVNENNQETIEQIEEEEKSVDWKKNL